MLDKVTKLPNGFGRMIRKDNLWMADGQFKDAAFHGYVRSINKNGLCLNQECKNG